MITTNLHNLTKRFAKTYPKHQDKHYMIVYVSNADHNCIFTPNDWNIDSQNKLVPSVSYLYHKIIIN